MKRRGKKGTGDERLFGSQFGLRSLSARDSGFLSANHSWQDKQKFKGETEARGELRTGAERRGQGKLEEGELILADICLG